MPMRSSYILEVSHTETMQDLMASTPKTNELGGIHCRKTACIRGIAKSATGRDRVKFLISTLFAITIAFPALAQVGPNIDELAKELANPGAAMRLLNFKLEYRTFDGDLPDADDQDSLTAIFQPALPFVLGNGNNLIFRPAFSYVVDQPIASASGFSSVSQFGDIPYDLLYSL